MSKMVKLQAIECMAGPSVLIQTGDIFERDDKEAHDLVKAGLAILLDTDPEPAEDHKPARKAKGHK